MKGHRIAWTPAQLIFIKRRQNLERRALHAEFVARFGPGIPLSAIASLCKRNGWLTGPRLGRLKGRLRIYSAEQIAFIRRHRTMPRRQLHKEFVRRFERPDLLFPSFMTLCKRVGAFTGRTGRFEKGSVPANKGKSMPYNANIARTQFKKGSRRGKAKELYKPIGSERLSKDGYLERKIHDGLPLWSRWRAVHLLNWESLNGPIPKGMALKCKGGRLNTDPSNWELVSRGVLPRLNGIHGRGYDDAPPELKPTILAVAKLQQQIYEKRK